MLQRRLLAFLALFLLVLVACNNNQTAATEQEIPTLNNLIPKPVQVKADTGFFTLNDSTFITVPVGDTALLQIARYIITVLKPATGFKLKIDTNPKPSNSITLALVNDSSLNNEGYELKVSNSGITINAFQPAGLFYGVQTIRQLLPAAIGKDSLVITNWQMATGAIRDYPEYAMRGAMLDVARHFFDVDAVKRYIDFLAYYKMNTLHLHLSDDQGWRIEIKKWPRLTEYGSTTQVGGGQGGFYTQEQYKDIVTYAANRFITVIPEIDMPGHTNAALASYPELNCNEKDKSPKLYTGIEVGFSTLCTQNEKVYQFVDDVLKELAAITPGPYLHIGGDESHATKKEDYIPFMNRVQTMVKKQGKQVIGWDEIANATLQPGTLAQYWADSANSKNAVKKGAKIIMSPAARSYMDMQYDSTSKLGLHWAGYIEVDKAYSWNPATLVDSIERNNIVGVIAPLWSETIVTMNDIEYMVFPRLPGYAEIAWSPASGRSWEEYKNRLGNHGRQMKAKHINYYPSKLVDWKQ
ncbi:MAG: beta-N-acetylhexosaminidase [Sphingobacteriales bacterium]|nr:MAG: beta-N-acetylhexosaminidase [Sphingobacteriales bacterium]